MAVVGGGVRIYFRNSVVNGVYNIKPTLEFRNVYDRPLLCEGGYVRAVVTTIPGAKFIKWRNILLFKKNMFCT